MVRRGATRPQMGGNRDDDGADSMTQSERRRMLEQHHQRTLWVYWLVVMLGVWMIVSPLTFSHSTGVVEVAGGRSLPWALSTRITALTWSDIVSGVLLVVFGLLSMSPYRPWARWGAAAVGVWLNFAPLLFWSPTAVGYLNDTLVGVLVVGLTILIPGMPWMIMLMQRGPEVPPGWSFNPSSWPQRWIMIATGFAGWLVSRYLAAYQMGFVGHVWDPFFGSGSVQVLTSRVSEMWPVSDGGLGAFSYTFEALMGFMGGTARWRTMPWMVTFFGFLVIPLGLTHIFLVISQPVLVGNWCFMCLLAAAIMLPMIPLEVDEVAAMIQFLVQASRDGKPLWATFWRGGTLEGGHADERSPQMTESPSKVIPAMFWGMSVAWNLLFTAVLGLWVMAVPSVLGDSGLMADVEHLAGALVVVVSVIALGEVVRPLRYLNLLLGVGIAAAPWLAQGATGVGQWNAVLVGLAVAALSMPRGPIHDRYGIFQRYII